MNQRYVSKELTHFIGKSLRNRTNEGETSYEIQQFQLLIRIISTGCLKSPHRDCSDSSSLTNPTLGVIHFEDVICFCDIPVDDLELHMRKYSRFGIAFKKNFLISRGANPVFYIINQSRVSSSAQDRVLFLDTIINRLGFLPLNPSMNPVSVNCFL